ncbi:MAG TPA: type IX secretion system membrane protein PorP/SprF, partial [Bacteroidales bacterium]|nr:type IX secretion system membrane protein PorP/SprF [Bacteroidales bacterium]
ECLLGGEVEYKLSENIRPYIGTSIRYGLSRNFDASSWIGGMQINNWRVGLSYDVNISGLQQATNNRGAFEVSLIYITPSVQSTFIKIPCDRL